MRFRSGRGACSVPLCFQATNISVNTRVKFCMVLKRAGESSVSVLNHLSYSWENASSVQYTNERYPSFSHMEAEGE